MIFVSFHFVTPYLCASVCLVRFYALVVFYLCIIIYVYVWLGVTFAAGNDSMEKVPSDCASSNVNGSVGVLELQSQLVIADQPASFRSDASVPGYSNVTNEREVVSLIYLHF